MTCPTDFADQVLHALLYAHGLLWFCLWAQPHVQRLVRQNRPRVVQDDGLGTRLIVNNVVETTRGGRHG